VEEFGIVVGTAARSKNILHDLWGLSSPYPPPYPPLIFSLLAD